MIRCVVAGEGAMMLADDQKNEFGEGETLQTWNTRRLSEIFNILNANDMKVTPELTFRHFISEQRNLKRKKIVGKMSRNKLQYTGENGTNKFDVYG